MKTKKCSGCGIVKSLSKFHIQRNCASGYRSRCKDCRNKDRLKRIRKPEYIYLKIQERLRDLKKKGRHLDICTQSEFVDWYKQQDRTCNYCLLPEDFINFIPFKANSGFLNKSRLEIDRADNAKGYVLGNLILSCPICNRVKGSLLTKKDMLKVGFEIIRPKWIKLLKKNKGIDWSGKETKKPF